MKQCKVCMRIRVDNGYRLPWPGEQGKVVEEVYCPRCARERLARVRAGVFSQDGAGVPALHVVNG